MTNSRRALPGAAGSVGLALGLGACAPGTENGTPDGNTATAPWRPADGLVAVEPELTRRRRPPAGLDDISLPRTRFLHEVRFGRSDPTTTAKAYVDELTSMLTG